MLSRYFANFLCAQ